MRIKVRLFDRLRALSGKTALSIDIRNSSTLRELIDIIAMNEGIEFKKLLLKSTIKAPLPNVRILVNGRNKRFTGGLETVLVEGDEVDLLTAVGGG